MKTITIEDKVWQKLVRLKTNLVAKNYTEVLEKLFKLVTKLKLQKELELLK